MKELVQIRGLKEKEPETSLLEIDLEKVPSPTLRRLIEEVRSPDYESSQTYSRFHNRHNRSSRPRPWPMEADK